MCRVQKDAFRAGESLTYKVYYTPGPMWVGAGEVYLNFMTLTIKERKHCTVFQKLLPILPFDWFFQGAR